MCFVCFFCLLQTGRRHFPHAKCCGSMLCPVSTTPKREEKANFGFWFSLMCRVLSCLLFPPYRRCCGWGMFEPRQCSGTSISLGLALCSKFSREYRYIRPFLLYTPEQVGICTCEPIASLSMGLFGKKHHAATSSPPPLRFNSLPHSTFRGRKARGQASGAKKDKHEDQEYVYYCADYLMNSPPRVRAT